MLGAWPQVSLCVRAGRRFGVLLLGAAEPPWTMRCPAMSCWLLQGPALRLAVSWYALLGRPVNAAGAGVGLAWHGPRAPWCVVKMKNRRCAAGFIYLFIFSAASAPRPSERPSATHVFSTPPPAWSQLPMRSGPVHAGAAGKWMRARARWPSRPGKTRCTCVDRTMGARPMS